jgi:hypothetical protein
LAAFVGPLTGAELLWPLSLATRKYIITRRTPREEESHSFNWPSNNSRIAMANQFIGLHMRVVLRDPPGYQLTGIVRDVEAGSSLTLRNGEYNLLNR